jgi:uncharacterized membrane protein
MWSPKEVQKLICQIAGIIFGIGGMLIIIKDIKTTGKISFTTKIFSGQIESGSEGLLLVFMPIFLLIVPSFSFSKSVNKDKKINSENVKKAIMSFFSFLGSALVLLVLSALIYAIQAPAKVSFVDSVMTLLFGFLALAFLITAAMYLVQFLKDPSDVFFTK